MAFDSSTVSIGESTKQSAYDRVMDNTVYLLSDVLTFAGAKTFSADPIVDGIDARTATGSVSIERQYQDGDGQGSKITTKQMIIEIGDWDMDTVVSISLNFPYDWKSIRRIEAFIRDDDDTVYLSLGAISSAGALGGMPYANSTGGAGLSRVTDGVFDNASYNATSYNRGWAVIDYEA